MNRIKFLLTALAVLAIVGGALAFKAKKFSQFCIYTIKGTLCPRVDDNLYDHWMGQPGSIELDSATFEMSCPSIVSPFSCSKTITVILESP